MHRAAIMKNSFTKPWTRRQLLQTSLLGTGLAAPVMPSLALPPPQSQSRVIFIYTPQGAPREQWEPVNCGSGFTLPRASSPLEPVKQHCVFFRDLYMPDAGHGLLPKVLGGGFTEGRETTLDIRLGEKLSANSRQPNLHLRAHANHSEVVSKKDNEQLFFAPGAVPVYEHFFGEDYADATPLDRKFLAQPVAAAENFDREVDLEIELSALALSRNVTNVITLMWGDTQAEFYLPESYVVEHPVDFHHAVTGLSGVEMYSRFRAYLSAKLTYLIQLLAVMPDENGISLLESTLVVHVTDMGDGRHHGAEHVPYLLAGGKNLFRNGLAMDVARATQYDLMDTIAKAYDLTDTQYGTRLIDGLLV
jgi:hypothetical protein